MSVEQNDNPGEQSSEKGVMSNAWRIPTLIVGDVLVFLIFAITGRQSHNEAIGLDAFLQILVTAAPFALAWFVVAPFLGAYKRGLEIQPRKMALYTLRSWVVAWPLGIILRAFIENHLSAWTFWVVSLIAVSVLLLAWRWPFALSGSMRARRNQSTEQN